MWINLFILFSKCISSGFDYGAESHSSSISSGALMALIGKFAVGFRSLHFRYVICSHGNFSEIQGSRANWPVEPFEQTPKGLAQ